MWHTDHCGNNLKVGILLQDTDEESHPTQVAGGSHKSRKFDITGWVKSAGVAQNFKVHSMTGRAGGGFIFDTNALHRANKRGKAVDRHSIMLDFNPVAGHL